MKTLQEPCPPFYSVIRCPDGQAESEHGMSDEQDVVQRYNDRLVEGKPQTPRYTAWCTMIPAGQERFNTKFVEDWSRGCWLWTGSIGKIDGYAQFRANGRTRKAHIVRYEQEFGPVPKGLELDHLCRCRHCVNPYHLEIVTRRVNLSRSKNAGAYALLTGRCQYGHVRTADNITSSRACKICKIEQQRARRTRRQLCQTS
jgi:hypothetical protein